MAAFVEPPDVSLRARAQTQAEAGRQNFGAEVDVPLLCRTFALCPWLFGIFQQGFLETGFLSPCWAWTQEQGREHGVLPGGKHLTAAEE